MKPYAEEAVNGYFLEMAQGWADQEEALIVRVSQLESRLLSIPFLRVPRQFKFRLFPGGDPLDFRKLPDGIGVIID